MPDAETSARIARLEDRFADFLSTMAEFKGSLTAEMQESKRQRTGLFRLTEQISHQLVEISTKFDAHVDAEEVLRIEFITRVTRVEERMAVVDAKADELEERTGQPCVAHAQCAPVVPPSDAPAQPSANAKPWYLMLGSGGVLTVVFGDNITEGITNVIKAVRAAFH